MLNERKEITHMLCGRGPCQQSQRSCTDNAQGSMVMGIRRPPLPDGHPRSAFLISDPPCIVHTFVHAGGARPHCQLPRAEVCVVYAGQPARKVGPRLRCRG